MIEMTKSFSAWLWKYHKDIYSYVLFGHIELLTDEMRNEYIEWLNTDEGKSYLKRGVDNE
jgi:hypothetical protein